MSNREKLMEKKLTETKEHYEKNTLTSIVILVTFVFGLFIYKFFKGEIDFSKAYYEPAEIKSENWKEIAVKILSNSQIYVIIIGFIGFYFLRKHNRNWELKNVYVYNEEDEDEIRNTQSEPKNETELEKIERFADAYIKNNGLSTDNIDKKND